MQRKFIFSISTSNKLSNIFFRSVHTKYSSTEVTFNGHETDFTPPFASARIGQFYQQNPDFGNFLQHDPTLNKVLKRHIPRQHIDKVTDDLTKFSNRLSSEIHDLGLQCEKDKPYVQTFDAWGKRIDKLVTCQAWKQLHNISAEEGLIALGYASPQEEWGRLYQMSKNYLFASSSGLYSCPLAMTDGAATIIRKLSNPSPSLQKAYASLTSRNPSEFWTSGQWMTEKRGGSDVANGTETVAVEEGDGSYRLYGYKWFSSATDADIAFTLARVVDKDGQAVEGTKGLSLFYLETKRSDGTLNGIQIVKLKDKLGTQQLPTAELLLDGTIATRVSELGKGVAEISSMLTLTRLHNALAACSNMRKMLILTKDYSKKREAFGNRLHSYPLHVQTLARMEVEARAATLFVFRAVHLLGKQESRTASPDDLHLLRLLTPLVKLYTGKQAVSLSSEGLESFGGQGYIEETGLPNFLRDSQVLTIWEGTTNILSLDVLRCISKSQGQVLMAFRSDVEQKLSGTPSELSQEAERIQTALKSVLEFVTVNQRNADILSFAARDLAFSLSRIYMGALMVDHAVHCGMSASDVYATKRWCDQKLSLVTISDHYNQQSAKMDTELVYNVE